MIHRFKDGEEYYVLPGGEVEKGESPENAVIREILEETSIVARLKSKPIVFTDYHTKSGEKSEHQLFVCDYISGTPRLSENSEENMRNADNNSYEPCWVNIDYLSNLNMKPSLTKDFLLSYLKADKEV
jgi:8-oxo-dGTP pyrophosphatase MutT (NUDIX family)